ncbi:hypothetical protein KR222_004916 [Zaprionus bogoriensis]|nr:hypothetical protein KR222_004916 [Zaprionus bogoriensis]
MERAYVYLGWFLALNGITRYYVCPRTGRLQKSRYLQYYSMVHNVLIIAGLPLFIGEILLRETVLDTRLNSHWIPLANFSHALLYGMLVLCCAYCAQFLQESIYRIIARLQSIEIAELPARSQRYMNFLIYVKLLVGSCYLIIYVASLFRRWWSVDAMKRICLLYNAFSISMTTFTSMLIYAILWKICHIAIGLQSQLKQLLEGRAEVGQLHVLYRQQQRLIAVCKEFCGNFRHVLLWYPMRILCTGVICAYFLIRIQLGQPNPKLNHGLAYMLLLIMLHALAEFYNLNKLAGDIANFVPNIFGNLQQAQPQSELVERAVSSPPFSFFSFEFLVFPIPQIHWMSLQLSCQRTTIHIFDVVALNKCFFFGVMAQIVLHTLYMVQNDYYLIMFNERV